MKKPIAPKRKPGKKTTPLAAVRVPPAALWPVRPFPKKAITSPETYHDLGPVVAPTDQAKAPGANLTPHVLASDARKLLNALTGSGPRQEPPHSGTVCALDEALARLRDHALEGDADAFAALGFILRNAVADFHEIARRRPALAAVWGERENTLPAMVGRNPGHAADLEAAFARFRLGEKSPYRVNSEKRKGCRAPNSNTPVNALAAGLCAHLNDHRPPRFPICMMRPPIPPWARLASDLPELSLNTAEQWSKAAFELIASSCANEAEIVTFCGLGDVREDDVANGVSPQISAIKARLRRAVHDLAAKT